MPGRTCHASATWVSTTMSRQTEPAKPNKRTNLRRVCLLWLVRAAAFGKRFSDSP
jgi:hypothetical protein